MSDPYLFFRELFQTFLSDYLTIAEPDSAGQFLPEEARSIVLDVPGWTDQERSEMGAVVEIPTRRGEVVTLLIQPEPEPRGPAETAERFGRYFLALEARWANPVLFSVVYLRGGRPGVNLETVGICKVFGMDVLRIFYTAFGLSGARGDYYLERPEPLAWALAALMRPVRRSPAEHKLACLERIAGADLPEKERSLLVACVEDWMEPHPPGKGVRRTRSPLLRREA